jgi:hypothetical protein
MAPVVPEPLLGPLSFPCVWRSIVIKTLAGIAILLCNPGRAEEDGRRPAQRITGTFSSQFCTTFFAVTTAG